MRQALNKNPIAQAALIGLLAIGVAFMLLTRVANRDEPAAAAPAPTTPSAAPSADPAATAPPTDATAAPTAPAGDASQAPTGAPGSPSAAPAATTDFVAGPGLPEPVVKAYEDGRPVVVLITRKAGVEDKRLRAMVDSARSIGDSAVFTTNAHGIARYSRITRGVDVSRVPALVVVRPRRLNDGPVPAATVSYGFRGPESVEQAVRDAVYDGRRDLPYYPE